MIESATLCNALRRTNPLIRISIKLQLALATRQGMDLDSEETKLFAKHVLPVLREHIEHREHPDELPPCGVSASLARCRRATRRGRDVPVTSVYFVQCVNGGPIKIGRARDVGRRFATLQTASAVPLTLLASSDRYDEADLHRFYGRERICGEWFRPSPRLCAFVETLK